MSNPVCPACHGSAVHPDQFSAGHNVCACGHRAPVAEFHPDPSGNPFEFMNRISGQPLFSQSMIDYAEQRVPFAKLAQSSAYGRINRPVSIFDTPVPSRAPVKHWSDD